MIPSVMFLAAFSLAAPVPDTSQEELKKIQGEWVVVKMAWAGESWEPKNRSATIEKDNLSLRDPTGTVRYTIKRINSGHST